MQVLWKKYDTNLSTVLLPRLGVCHIQIIHSTLVYENGVKYLAEDLLLS